MAVMHHIPRFFPAYLLQRHRLPHTTLQNALYLETHAPIQPECSKLNDDHTPTTYAGDARGTLVLDEDRWWGPVWPNRRGFVVRRIESRSCDSRGALPSSFSA